MAFDEGLAQRIREAMEERRDVDEKKMFGGLAFMVRGHMTVGIVGEELMVRVGAEAYEASLALPHAKPMTFTGKALKTMVYVSTDGFESDEDLSAWIERGLAFNATLAPKQKKAAKKAKRKTARKRG